jgi:hypothetical protein
MFEMSAVNITCLVTSVVFDMEYKVGSNLLVSWRRRIAPIDACINEALVLH